MSEKDLSTGGGGAKHADTLALPAQRLEINGVEIKWSQKMEAKISVKKNPEISFTFDNQKKDPNTKEGSKLQAKVTIKCNLIKNLTLGPLPSPSQSVLLEIAMEKMPTFTKQMRTSASVKKPKWTAVNDTEEECGFNVPSLRLNTIRAFMQRDSLTIVEAGQDKYKRLCDLLRKIPALEKVMTLRDINQPLEERRSPEESKHVAPPELTPKIKPEPMVDTSITSGAAMTPRADMSRQPGVTTPRGRASSRGERVAQHKTMPLPLQNLRQFPHNNAYQAPMQHMVPRYPDSNGMGAQPMTDTMNAPHNIQYAQPPTGTGPMYYQQRSYMRPYPKEPPNVPPVKYQPHDQPMENGQPTFDVPEMVNQVRNMISTYKKGPSKKQKKMRCPQYGCWKSFQRFEDLQTHIAGSHDWMKTKGLKPLPDGRFHVSEQILKTVFDYGRAYPGEVAKVISDVEKEIQSKKHS